MSRWVAAAAGWTVALSVSLTACGGGPAGEVLVRDAVAGEARAGAEVAVYFEVESGGGDAIVSASSSTAERSSLHELQPVEGGGIMMPSDRITLVDGMTVLAPNGSHVMLSGLAEALVAGDMVPLTLEFEHHDPITVEVAVVPLYELAELVDGDR
jgi:copper(I)-binding protein